MPSEASTSYQGVTAEGQAKLHAGHNIYGNVTTNNYSNQHDATSPDPSSSISTPSSRIELAPEKHPVHKYFREAVKEGQTNIRLEQLLLHGANLDSRDKLGLTPLYYASFRGDVRTVRFLLERGPNVNVKDGYFGTPLAVAALKGHPEVVKLLLQHEALVLDAEEPVAALGSAIHCACFGGNVDVFTAIMLKDLDNDYLSLHRVVKLKGLSMLSAADLKPSCFGSLLRNEEFAKGPAIRCTPIFLAGERCRFDILRLSWSDFGFAYFSLNLWNFSDEEEKAERREIVRSRRIKSPYSSVESRSGPSYVSKASTSSAWSNLSFDLVTSEPYQSTLLMWAAASLNLPLIKHLLKAGAYALIPDQTGRTALHYAATPFADATFSKVGACVELILASQTLCSGMRSIQFGQGAELSYVPLPLNLVVSADHEALDPRIGYKWGRNVHQNFISAFLDPLPGEDLKAKFAREALPYALDHATCPAESIELLCKHAVEPCDDYDCPSLSDCMNESLVKALRSSADAPIISILLRYGADPNAARPQRPLITAIDHMASEAVVAKLLFHGADPYNKGRVGTPMTPNQYAKEANRQDLLLLFKDWTPTSRLAKLTPSQSPDPVATKSPQPDPRENLPKDSPIDIDDLRNALNRLTELDDDDDMVEVDGQDENSENELEADAMYTRKDSAGSADSAGRSWFSSISNFPLSKFRKSSKPK